MTLVQNITDFVYICAQNATKEVKANTSVAKQYNELIELMNYDIPADTTRLLDDSKRIALAFRLPEINTLCMLKSVINNDMQVVEKLAALKVDATLLGRRIDERLDEQSAHNEAPSEDRLAFDADCSRIIKLLMLENRLAAGKRNAAMLLVMAMLHDRDNEAKQLLESCGVNYETFAHDPAKAAEVTNDYQFPDEADGPYPGDERMSDKPRETRAQEGKPTSDTPITENFGTDLTAVALKGGLDPVVGRERETERVIEILCRRKKNNPILIGEPGVGKSAIVEGLADRIAHHKVPRLLAGKRIVALDMASIVAGTQYRGQFEERLRRLIQELKEHPEIVLFMDEIHTIIGAGSAPGSLDAANMLKPALARGEVQCIGATTTAEFKKSIEKDGALDRRFQKVMLEPTTADETRTILNNIRERYEKHHNVTYTPEALKACVELTDRYVTDRALPDKAIDALDEAGARKHLQEAECPQELVEKEREIESVRKAKTEAAQQQNYELAANLRDKVTKLTHELDELTLRWQNDSAANPAVVDAAEVAEVVSLMSGVPVTRVAASESERLKGMHAALNARVIAQEKAVERLSRAIARSRMGLKGANRPIGTFLFVGPTGVGKTHLVKCLAEWMFGRTDALIRIDMSEYGEKYSVSRLLGAPPGYVGYEEGGQLTERVRRHPYSVVLLDEIEKAHPDVFNTLLQVMDEGRLTDGNGATVSFQNTIIILTSNSGTRQLREFGKGVGFDRIEGELSGDLAEGVIMKALRKQFAPEFLNRLDDIIMFNPLTRDDAARIARLELEALQQRLAQNDLQLTWSEAVADFMVDKGFDSQYGARSLKRAIQHHLEDALCDFMMEHPGQNAFQADMHDGKVAIQ